MYSNAVLLLSVSDKHPEMEMFWTLNYIHGTGELGWKVNRTYYFNGDFIFSIQVSITGDFGEGNEVFFRNHTKLVMLTLSTYIVDS